MAARVFITGASGYLGSAIAARLVRAGLDARGLARTPDRARWLESAGVEPIVGDLAQPDTYLAELKNCDVVVHAAYDDDGPAGPDQTALEAFRTAAQDGRVRRLLYTSGVWVHGDTGGAIADESAPLAAAERVRWRPAHEQAAFELAEVEVTTVVLRPGMVYGGRGGTFGGWFREAKEKGTVTYPGTGAQHWSMIHRDDLAEAYRLALDHARGGNRFLLVDESRYTVREMAEAVAVATGARAVPTDPAELVHATGTLGAAYLMDQRFTAARARRELGWVPRHTSFVVEADALLREWQESAATVG